MTDIYLFGEEHNNHEFRMTEIELIKELSEKNKIKCVSLELEVYKYQPILDSFSFETPPKEIGDYLPQVYISKKRNLDVIASDYRDFLSGHLITFLRNLDDKSNKSDKEKEKIFEKYLLPIKFQNGVPSEAYMDFSKDYEKSEDIFDFIITTYDEERRRFTAHRLEIYKQKNPDSNILHICGLNHVRELKNKMQKYEVEIIH